MTTKRVESLWAPCLDASSTLATSTKHHESGIVPLFVFVEGGERRSAGSPLGLCRRLTLGAIISLNSITAKKLTADC